MIKTPTLQQQRAIRLTGPNVIVSAAAGSGKTAVLIDRAVTMIKDGTNVDALLMLTFTNAAAVQMRTRIMQELLDLSAQHCDAHLREQAELIETADICTIDSFCLKLVRRYFHMVDVDPLFAIASDKEQSVLREQTLVELLDACFDRSEQPFLDAIEALADNSEDTLKKRILQIYTYAQTSADPQGWLSRAAAMYQGGEATCNLLMEETALFFPKIMQVAELCQSAAEYVESNRGPGKPVSMSGTLELCAQTFRSLCNMPLSAAFCDTLRSVSLPAKNPRNARMDSVAFAPVARSIEQVKEICDELKAHPIILYGPDAAADALMAMAPHMTELRLLIDLFEQLYAAKKAERNMLDYSDIEHFALRILQNESVSSTLQTQYSCVFVDEYQDTNDLQEAIITRLARPGALFCVGDVKQSIYAFRHAEPALFLCRYQKSAADSPDCTGSEDVRLHLNTNFRSTKTILSFVNDVFSRCMRHNHGGVDYDEEQALCPGLEEQGSPITVRLTLKPEHASDDEDAVSFNEIQRQALACAQRIRELLQQRFFDGQTMRHYRYEDIAILLRKLKGLGPGFVSTLMSMGIPVISNVSADVLSAQETGAMLSLLKVVDNARDDLSMLAALRSPAARLCAADLAKIRAHDKTLPFALAAKSFAGNATGVSADRVRAFFEKLANYRDLSTRVRVDALLSYIYSDTNAQAYYALLPDGDQKAENLQALWLQAQTFARLDDGSLYGFLQQLKLHSELGVSEVASAPGGSNAVRVMTIHGAKGLEFPAVLLPFLNQKLNLGSNFLQMTRQQGIGLPAYHQPTQTRQKSVVQVAVERKNAQVERDEQLRLLYVALTRAQNDLTLVGEGTLPQFQVDAALPPEKAKSFLGWMLPSLLAHPDCRKLCDESGQSEAHSGYRVELSLLEESALAPLMQPVPCPSEPYGHVDLEDLSYIKERLFYRYPFEGDAKVPGKISVSQLNAHKSMPFEPLTLPSLQTETKLDAAGIGTAVHRAMLKLDFYDVASIARIDAQLDSLLELGLLSEIERNAINPELLYAFFNTGLGMRLQRSARILREQPFVLRIPARAYEASLSQDATTTLQGIIDCAFMEDDAWVLLDYKTNRLPNGGLEALRSQYQIQMDAYRRALETLTQIPVKQCTLCLLMLQEQLEIAPGELYGKLVQN